MIVRDPLRGWAEIYFNDLGWFGFQKFYVMTSTEIDLYDIVHVKAHIFPVPKMWTLAILGKFVWTTHFEQCEIENGVKVQRCLLNYFKIIEYLKIQRKFCSWKLFKAWEEDFRKGPKLKHSWVVNTNRMNQLTENLGWKYK